jgi:hypothetical protein
MNSSTKRKKKKDKILILFVKMKRAYDQVGVMNVILAHLHQMPGVLLFFLTIIYNIQKHVG